MDSSAVTRIVGAELPTTTWRVSLSLLNSGRQAHIYQDRYDKDACIENNLTPLSLFVYNLNDIFENSYLLDIYSRNNPDFMYDINHVNCDYLTVPDEDINKALEVYISTTQNGFDNVENADIDTSNME